MNPDDYQPDSTAVFLSPDTQVRRAPLAPHRKRPESFLQSFEDRALVYDCFWDAQRSAIIVVGPPGHNLDEHWQAARWQAGGLELKARYYPSRSTQLIALSGAPAETSVVVLEFAGAAFVLPVRENFAQTLRGRNILVTMNKDNDLDWIKAWALWHVKLHDADACVFFDNGSSRYGPGEIVDALKQAGIELPYVLSWPYKYGRKDPAVFDRPHYPHFLQVSSLNVALRRFAMCASGLLNCDIDELVSGQGGSVFNAAQSSPTGLVTLKGTWIQPVGEDGEVRQEISHLSDRYAHRLPLLARCANKWVLDPQRGWLKDLSAKPSVHRMYDVPKSLSKEGPERAFWHFKAINTGWKEVRSKRGRVSWLLKRQRGLDADVERFVLATSS